MDISMEKKRKIFELYLVVSIYLLLNIIIYYLSVNAGTNGISLHLFGAGDDGFFYWEQVQNIINGNPWTKTSVYPIIISFFVLITGVNDPIIARLINWLALVLAIVLLIKIINKQFNTYYDNNKKIKKNSSIRTLLIILLLYPSLQANVNLSIIRDIWICLFYLISLYFSIDVFVLKQARIINLIGLTLSLIVLSGLRGYLVVSFIISTVFYYIGKINNGRLKSFIFIGLLSLFLFYTYFRNYSFPIINRSLVDALNYRFNSVINYSGGSQMMIDLNQDNFLQFIIKYLYSYIGNLLGPLPWQVNSFGTFIIMVSESICMTSITIYIFINRKLLNKAQKFMLVHSSVWIGIIAVINDNLGTSTRLRLVSWLIIIVVFSVIKTVRNKV